MGDILSFRRRRVCKLHTPIASDQPETRAALELALEKTLDAVDYLVAQLDRLDGDPDLEAAGDEEPSLAAPTGGPSQVLWATGNSLDLEQALSRFGRACNATSQETNP